MEMLDAMALQNSMLTRSQKQMSKKQQYVEPFMQEPLFYSYFTFPWK